MRMASSPIRQWAAFWLLLLFHIIGRGRRGFRQPKDRTVNA
jgi:hypothetical protein